MTPALHIPRRSLWRSPNRLFNWLQQDPTTGAGKQKANTNAGIVGTASNNTCCCHCQSPFLCGTCLSSSYSPFKYTATTVNVDDSDCQNVCIATGNASYPSMMFARTDASGRALNRTQCMHQQGAGAGQRCWYGGDGGWGTDIPTASNYGYMYTAVGCNPANQSTRQMLYGYYALVKQANRWIFLMRGGYDVNGYFFYGELAVTDPYDCYPTTTPLVITNQLTACGQTLYDNFNLTAGVAMGHGGTATITACC